MTRDELLAEQFGGRWALARLLREQHAAGVREYHNRRHDYDAEIAAERAMWAWDEVA